MPAGLSRGRWRNASARDWVFDRGQFGSQPFRLAARTHYGKLSADRGTAAAVEGSLRADQGGPRSPEAASEHLAELARRNGGWPPLTVLGR
jgi:hypothetical protein